MENVGYQSSGPGQNLFVANWDWRVPVAPTDADAISNPNGVLSNVSASGITDTQFQSGLDYLGSVLKQIKDANPLVTKVDVIAHSTGGLIARSYVQSAAYGAVYDGIRPLPTIDDLVMVGVPNEGVADPWSFAFDDFSANSVSRGLAMVTDRAYDLMRNNGGTVVPIVGPDYVINNPSISKQDFVRQYIAGLQHLVPTYEAIDTNSDRVFEKIALGTPSGNTLVNRLLTDINAPVGGRQEYVAQPSGQDECHLQHGRRNQDRIVVRTGPDSRGFLSDEILSFPNYIGRRPEVGETLVRNYRVWSMGEMAPFLRTPQSTRS